MCWFWLILSPRRASNSKQKPKKVCSQVAKAPKKGAADCMQIIGLQNIYPSQICSWGVPWSDPLVKCRVGSRSYGIITRSLINSVTIFLDHGDELLKMIEIRAQQVVATIWLIKTLHPKHGKLSRIKVLITQLTMITSCRLKALIQNGPQVKERAITDKMLNSARAEGGGALAFIRLLTTLPFEWSLG